MIGNLGACEIILVVVILLGLFTRRKSGLRIPTLVLKRFKVDDSFSTQTPIEIVGRASGLTAWLLTIMGLDAETNLSVHNSKVSFKRSSLYGEVHLVIPMPSISSTHCGYSKPFGLLILGIILFIAGIYAQQILVGVILGGIFIISYFLTKKISISLETSGGMLIGLSFKRSVIENVSIDIEQALKVITIINDSILKQLEKK